MAENTTGLGIAPLTSTGEGVTPLMHRRTIAGRWANIGIVNGLTLSTTNSMAYRISDGIAVVSSSDLDGMVEMPINAQDIKVSAGDSTYSRIDVIYAYQSNTATDNTVHVECLEGTPAATPQRPTVPANGVMIGVYTLPAKATSTKAAKFAYYGVKACLKGASLGMLGRNWEKRDGDYGGGVREWYYELPVSFTVGCEHLVMAQFEMTANAWNGSFNTQLVSFQLDGQEVEASACERRFGVDWEDWSPFKIFKVSKGYHTVRIRIGCTNKEKEDTGISYHYSNGSDPFTYKGYCLTVWDLGAV